MNAIPAQLSSSGLPLAAMRVSPHDLLDVMMASPEEQRGKAVAHRQLAPDSGSPWVVEALCRPEHIDAELFAAIPVPSEAEADFRALLTRLRQETELHPAAKRDYLFAVRLQSIIADAEQTAQAGDSVSVVTLPVGDLSAAHGHLDGLGLSILHQAMQDEGLPSLLYTAYPAMLTEAQAVSDEEISAEQFRRLQQLQARMLAQAQAATAEGGTDAQAALVGALTQFGDALKAFGKARQAAEKNPDEAKATMMPASVALRQDSMAFADTIKNVAMAGGLPQMQLIGALKELKAVGTIAATATAKVTAVPRVQIGAAAGLNRVMPNVVRSGMAMPGMPGPGVTGPGVTGPGRARPSISGSSVATASYAVAPSSVSGKASTAFSPVATASVSSIGFAASVASVPVASAPTAAAPVVQAAVPAVQASAPEAPQATAPVAGSEAATPTSVSPVKYTDVDKIPEVKILDEAGATGNRMPVVPLAPAPVMTPSAAVETAAPAVSSATATDSKPTSSAAVSLTGDDGPVVAPVAAAISVLPPSPTQPINGPMAMPLGPAAAILPSIDGPLPVLPAALVTSALPNMGPPAPPVPPVASLVPVSLADGSPVVTHRFRRLPDRRQQNYRSCRHFRLPPDRVSSRRAYRQSVVNRQ